MKNAVKTYLSDTVINIFAQVIVLFSGMLSLHISNYSFLFWLIIPIGYAFILALMENGCEKKKGTTFRQYLLWVMLPANVIALPVGAILIAVGLSSGALYINAYYGILILGGSLAITLLAAILKKTFINN